MSTNPTEPHTFFKIDTRVVDFLLRAMKPGGVAVYLALCRMANRDGECFPSQRTLAEITGLDRGGVRKAVARLVADSLVAVRVRQSPRGDHTSCVYTILPLNGTAKEKKQMRRLRPPEPELFGAAEGVGSGPPGVDASEPTPGRVGAHPGWRQSPPPLGDPYIDEQDPSNKIQLKARAAGGPGPPSPESICQEWQKHPNLKPIVEWTPARQKALELRAAEPVFRAHWAQAVAKAAQSPFWQSRGGCGIDWFLRADSVRKLLEGDYDRLYERGAGERDGVKARAVREYDPGRVDPEPFVRGPGEW